MFWNNSSKNHKKILKFHETFRFSSQNVSDFPQSFVENSWFVLLPHVFLASPNVYESVLYGCYMLFCASRVLKIDNKHNRKYQKRISQNLDFCVFFVTQLGTGALTDTYDHVGAMYVFLFLRLFLYHPCNFKRLVLQDY